MYLGKLLLNRSSSIEEVARVQQIHLHQYYDSESHDYDLALLKLDRPAYALLTGHARPACLPPATHQLEPGLLCWVTGWGAQQEGGELANRSEISGRKRSGQGIETKSKYYSVWKDHVTEFKVCQSTLEENVR